MEHKHITMDELWHNMHTFNCEHPELMEKARIGAVIVYKESNFTEHYTETERSYIVWNNNRMFQPDKIANSLFGDCLDGKDFGVRLDWYNWDIEYCYMFT